MSSGNYQNQSNLTFTSLKGLGEKCLQLLRDGKAVFSQHLDSNHFVQKALEFSFSTSATPSSRHLRYAIDMRHLPLEGVRSLLKLYFEAFQMSNGNSGMRQFEALRKKMDKPDYLPGGIGIDEDMEGRIFGLKTYWQPENVERALFPLLPKGEKDQYLQFRNALQKSHPKWNIKFFAVDFLPQGAHRYKVYFPMDDHVRPFELEVLPDIFNRLGWHVDPESLAKIAFFVLDGESFVHPEAFSIGCSLEKESSFKLEIVPKAYFADDATSIARIIGLTESLHLSPTPILEGVQFLTESSPFKKAPSVEVVCIDFRDSAPYRVTVYLQY